jgi:hypothetical protein
MKALDRRVQAIHEAVAAERDRIQKLCLDQYVYWRDIESTDPVLTHLSMGAMGAASNILAGILGLEKYPSEPPT